MAKTASDRRSKLRGGLAYSSALGLALASACDAPEQSGAMTAPSASASMTAVVAADSQSEPAPVALPPSSSSASSPRPTIVAMPILGTSTSPSSAQPSVSVAPASPSDQPSSNSEADAGVQAGASNASAPEAGLTLLDASASERLPDADLAGESDDRCNIGVYAGRAPRVLELQGDTFAHDPTVLQAGGLFYRYWTGDYVPSAVSSDLQVWSNAESVYGRTYPSWVDDWQADNPGNTFNFPWAPDASFFEGE
ncbi:MAG TPA: hypothetical protein VHM70_17300, partial [Polyangiaceae bacterium]|nr:hypothetical protein [Polyangiaceae bacterium]